MLVTHRHPDHFDPLAIRKIVGDSGLVVGNREVTALAAAHGFKVRESSVDEPVLLGDFTAAAVPAIDGYGDPQLSWVVTDRAPPLHSLVRLEHVMKHAFPSIISAD